MTHGCLKLRTLSLRSVILVLAPCRKFFSFSCFSYLLRSSVQLKLRWRTLQIKLKDSTSYSAAPGKNLILREEKSRAGIQSVVMDVQQPLKIVKHSELKGPTAAHKLVRQKTDSSLLSRARFLQDGPPPKSFGGRGAPKLRKQSLESSGSPKLGKVNLVRRASNVSGSTSSSLSLSGSRESLNSLSPMYGSTTEINTEKFPKPGTIQKLSSPVKLGQYSPKNSYVKNTFRRKNPKTVKNAVYCIVVLQEWLKELAAISQEHALLLGGGEDCQISV